MFRKALPLFFVTPLMLFVYLLMLTPVQAGDVGTCSATPDDGTTVFAGDTLSVVQQAILSGTEGATIKVAGTCRGSGLVIYANSITLRGGYASDNWTISNPDVSPTILDANREGRVMDVFQHDIVIENLTIMNGLASEGDRGGGIRLFSFEHHQALLRNVVIKDNETNQIGGGLYSRGMELTMENVVFSNNSARASGGGLYYECDATLVDGECAATQIRDSSFVGNQSTEGASGALYIYTGTVAIQGSEFLNNTVNNGHGGAICISQSTVSIIDSVISANSTQSGNGGAIYNRYGMVNMRNVVMEGNSALGGEGGAIYNGRGMSLTDSRLRDNHARAGGAIFGHGFEDFTIVRSTISNNTATNSGGGIVNEGGVMRISESTLDNNHASFTGGSIQNNYGPGQLTIERSTISNSSVSADISGGGGLYNSGKAILSNSTLSGNSAESIAAQRANISDEEIESLLGQGGGGAIWNNGGSGSLTLTHVTIADNSADVIGEYLFAGGIHNNASANLNMTHNLIADNVGGDCFNRANLLTNLSNWIEDGGCEAALTGDPALEPLADNLGETFTHALREDSPAIDTVDVLVGVDQRGVFRPQGTRADVGAFEWTATPLIYHTFLPIVIK